jgi:hypothetical protein
MSYLYSQLNLYPERKEKFDLLVSVIEKNFSTSYWNLSNQRTAFGQGLESYDLCSYQTEEGLTLLAYAIVRGNALAFEYFISRLSTCNPSKVFKYQGKETSLLKLALDSKNHQIFLRLLGVLGTTEEEQPAFYSEIFEGLLALSREASPTQTRASSKTTHKDWSECLSVFLEQKIRGKVQCSSVMLSSISSDQLAQLLTIDFLTRGKPKLQSLELSFPAKPRKKPDDKRKVFEAIKVLENDQLIKNLVQKILAGPTALRTGSLDDHWSLVDFFWRSRGVFSCRRGRGILKDIETYSVAKGWGKLGVDSIHAGSFPVRGLELCPLYASSQSLKDDATDTPGNFAVAKAFSPSIGEEPTRPFGRGNDSWKSSSFD